MVQKSRGYVSENGQFERHLFCPLKPGYGDTPDKVPETLKWAMILQMKLLYDDYRPEEKTKLEEARNALLSMNRVIPV